MRALAAAVLFAASTGAVAHAQSVTAGASFPTALNNAVLESWLRGNTTIKSNDIIAVGGGRVVALVSKTRKAGSPSIVKLTVRTELVDKAAAEETKALSESSVLEVDCAGRRAKLTEALQYAGRNMIGMMQINQGWSDWQAPAPNTALDRMVSVACETATIGLRREASKPLALKLPSLPPVVAPPASLNSAARPSSLVVPPWPSAPPMISSTERGPATVAKAAPRPEPAVVRAAPPPEPAVVSPSPPPEPPPASSPPPAAAPPAPVAPVPRAARFGSWVQIGALNSRGEAEAALGQAQTSLATLLGGRPTTVESTMVSGQTYYRALVGGFTDSGEALRMCDQLKALGRGCVVRVR